MKNRIRAILPKRTEKQKPINRDINASTDILLSAIERIESKIDYLLQTDQKERHIKILHMER